MSVENVSPTRINLIRTKKTLNLAQAGRDVLERKRDILLRELRNSIYESQKAREELQDALMKAYQNLKEANMSNGSETIANLTVGTCCEADFLVDFRSIMGVPVPKVEFQSRTNAKPDYGFANTNVDLDKAFTQFYKVLDLLADLAAAEGTTFQIANDIRRTQRRVNALNHVLIPMYRNTVKQIALVLEEKDREEFVRTKSIKHMIRGKAQIES